ncbi:hypothetical protein TNCV_1414411 [Trichonephila clavipes]|nr:hypothetical protein TNCV_1414411 [Trichonephila clavipes]
MNVRKIHLLTVIKLFLNALYGAAVALWLGYRTMAEGEKDYNDDHRDEITDFVQSIPGFEGCHEDRETCRAIDAEDSVDFKC